MSSKDPKPEIMRLEELALLVKGGEIKLPRFQRPFVWLRADMLKLLDSIYKGYPIGSILVWNSSQRLISERNIAGLQVDDKELGAFPTNYLLDGQQRLTTLCGALFWSGGEHGSQWDIHFDLDTEVFVYPKDPNVIGLFPLNRLIETGDFIRQCMKFEHHPKRQRFLDVAEKLLRVIKDYKIAVVKIGDMTIEEVAPIFERINSTGRKLTIVDLMMAATWSNGFDLTDEIKKIREQCKKDGFDEISDQLVLRSISAAAGLGINKEDIQRLRSQTPTDLLRATTAAGAALAAALRFLRNAVGLHDSAYLPYGLQLTYVAEFFRLNASPSANHLAELKRWFWITSVTKYFSGANTGQNTKDLARIRAFASGNIEEMSDHGEIDVSRFLFDRFNLRNATSTAFGLLLGFNRPTATIDGRPIDDSYLIIKSSRFYADVSLHISGRFNIGKVIFPFSDPPNVDLSWTNLSSNLLDEDCIRAVMSNQLREFMAARGRLVAKQIEELTGCSAVFDLPQDLSADDERSVGDDFDQD